MHPLTVICVAIAITTSRGYVHNSVNCQGIACENVKTDINLSCPDGQSFNGNFCVGNVATNSATCPSGASWDGSRCFVAATTQHTCRRGYRQRGQYCFPIMAHQSCCNANPVYPQYPPMQPHYPQQPGQPQQPHVPQVPLIPEYQPPTSQGKFVCPDEFTLNGNECYKLTTTEHNCHEEFTVRGNACYKTSEVICPADSEMVNGRCTKTQQREVICPHYYTWNGELCVQQMPPCQDGFVLVGDMCERTTQPTCGMGQFYRDGHCFKEEFVASECQNGYSFNGRECFVTKPICPIGYIYENDACTLKTVTRPVYTQVEIPGSSIPLPMPVPQPEFPTAPEQPVYPPPTIPDYYPATPSRPVCPNQGPRCSYQPNYPVLPVQRRKYCPSNYSLENDVCLYRGKSTNESTNTEQTEFRTSPTDFVPQQGVGGSPSIVNTVSNVNEINNTTNVVSSNHNNVHVHLGQEGCGSYKVLVNNGETIHVPDEKCVSVDQDESHGSQRCCEVVSPRQCVRKGDQWNCFHRVHHRCGSFCTSDKIYLAPRNHCYQNQRLMMPPRTSVGYGTRVQARVAATSIDCSGCISGGYECSEDCYDYGCDRSSCNYVDLQQFCQQYGGRGCAQEDTGCWSTQQ